jgi:class 3 adenylate cyclase
MEQKQPVRIGRRLAAIIAADVVGYSRLMGLDEVGTARTLREHRKVTDALVAKHGGRLVKTTGDGELLQFPSVVHLVGNCHGFLTKSLVAAAFFKSGWTQHQGRPQ